MLSIYKPTVSKLLYHHKKYLYSKKSSSLGEIPILLISVDKLIDLLCIKTVADPPVKTEVSANKHKKSTKSTQATRLKWER